MALKKKTVVLNLAQMGNQKTDPKSLTPGSPTLVENAQFVKGNRVDKRFGYDAIGLGDITEFYQEFSFHAVDDILQSKRVFVIDPGNDPGDVALDFVQPFPTPSFEALLAEVQAYLNIPGGILKIRDLNNVEWVVTRLNPMTITGQVAAAAFATVIIGLRTSGVDDVTITKDGIASSPTAMLAEFGDYEYSDSATYAGNNPEGPVRRVGPQIFTDRKSVIGSEEHLLMLADGNVHSYSETLDTFPVIGPHRPAEITLDAINEDGRPLQSTDCVHLDGITYYVHTEIASIATNAVMAVTAIDEATGERIFGPLALGGDKISVIRLRIFQGSVYAFYTSNSAYDVVGNLHGRKITSEGLESEVLMLSNIWQNIPFPGGNHWDILNYNDERLIVAYPTSLTVLNIRHFDADLVVYALPVFGSTVTAFFYLNLSMSSSGDRYFLFNGAIGANGLSVLSRDLAGNDLLSNTLVGIDATPQMKNTGALATVATPQELNGADGVRGYLSQGSQTFDDEVIYGFVNGATSWHIANDGTLTVTTRDKEGFGYEVLSQGYLFEGNTYYLLYRGAVKDTGYYIGSWEGDNLIITCQVLYGRAPSGASNYSPIMYNMNFTEISPGVARVSVITKDSLTTVTGVTSIKVDFTSKDTFSAEPYGRSLLIAGTNLHTFCGQYFRELGFFHIPKAPVLTFQSSGGQVDQGLYKVVAVYEFTDRNGYLHRSGPSAPSEININSGAANTITAEVECYNVTNLTGANTLVGIITYRTEADGSNFHRDAYYDFTNNGNTDARPENQKNFTTSDANSIVMSRSSAELGTQAFLFTTSGEFPPSPIPPVKYLSTWGSRIWAAGSARDEAIYFSKVNQTNLMPEFSEVFSISVQDKPGKTTGIKGMTDKIILSKRGRLFFSYGDGPDNIGGGGGFAKFEEIPGVSGAISGRSMVVTEKGISYRSDKGVYTLTPGLETVFTGAAYEDSIDEEILEAITPIDSETLRFVTATGILSYNNFFNSWSKDSSASLVPIDATLYANKFHVLTATELLRENLNKWTDGDTSYDILVETGWISFSGLAGFQRFYKLFMVMDNLTPYDVRVSLAYDYGDYESETFFSNVTDSRIIIYPTKQKCEAFRFKIEATGTSGSEESLNINFVAVEVGTKSGLPKQLPVAQRIGVTTI